jgi:hypothetical protein
MDIAFGDCISVGGFCYALILVDRATRYNWTFGLKDLTLASIISALRLFKASAGSLARTFYSDCNLKLFGTAVNEFFMSDSSKVVSAPAKRQSANDLVESHWKVMVHMAWAYLTKKQMPQAFWFCAITHTARMMNAIPGNHSGLLVSPFLLVHGVGHDKRTWIPIFSLCYFHHDRDGDLQAPSIRRILWMALSLAVHPLPMLSWFTIRGIASIMSLTVIGLIPTVSRGLPIRTSNMMEASFAAFSATTTLILKRSTLLVLVWSKWTPPETCFYQVLSWTFLSCPMSLMSPTSGPTRSSLTMVPWRLFHSRTWQVLFLPLPSCLHRWGVLRVSSLRSFS